MERQHWRAHAFCSLGLLLRMKESHTSDLTLISIYIFYNAVYAILAYPFGALADKTRLKKIFLAELTLFALVYTGMCFHRSTYFYLLLFFLYGAYAAATEGISKAWIAKMVNKERVATSIGTYTGFRALRHYWQAVLRASCGYILERWLRSCHQLLLPCA